LQTIASVFCYIGHLEVNLRATISLTNGLCIRSDMYYFWPGQPSGKGCFELLL